MMILSKDLIVAQADRAAALWVLQCALDPQAPKPTSPYDWIIQPEHYRVWKAALERYLQLQAEGSA